MNEDIKRAYYQTNLSLFEFAQILDDPTECYKFYWFDAILNFVEKGESKISFSDIFDEMIADAWFSVAEHHLHLGPKSIAGEVKNSIERAILIVMSTEELSFDNKQQVLSYIQNHQDLIIEQKKQLVKNVPYRLLSSFMPEIGGNDEIWYQTTRLMEYLIRLNETKRLPYIIENNRGLNKSIVIDDVWRCFLEDNLPVLKGWVRERKIEFLQKRNPNVPGVVYKLDSEKARERKLKYVRGIWNKVFSVTQVIDIYSGNVLLPEDYEVDHFVPSSYIAHDEMWNLLPIESRLNSQKGNKLPRWNQYFLEFADRQYLLYYYVFVKGMFRADFEKCYKDNIISPWAQDELFVKGKTKGEFTSILETNMHPIYETAKGQGYGYWDVRL